MSNTNYAKEYFDSYSISERLLKHYHVETNKDHEFLFEIRYHYMDGSTKICTPNSKDYKWKFINSSKNEVPKVFGFDRLPEKGNICIVTGGEKDVLSFASYGIPAICFNSETASFDIQIIKDLRNRFQKLIVCFDNDKTGVDQSSIKSEEFELSELRLPNIIGCKDISDFRKAGFTKEELEDYIQENLTSHKKRKSIYTAGEILDGGLITEKDGLIKGILPNADVVGFVGGSQSGKSLLSLQLLISLAIGKDFLGFKVERSASSIYVSLEDNEWALRSRLIKQLKEKSKEEIEKVKNSINFICSPDNVIYHLKSLLRADKSIGIVIIDPLTEVMNGKDLNNAMHVRESLQELREICWEFGITIVYLHHVGKSAETNGAISKLSILGSHAFEASSRLIIQMQRSNDGSNKLAITKGNYIDDELKHPKSYLQLMLDETTCSFKKLESIKINNESKKKLDIDWFLIFGDESELTTKNIKERVKDKYNLSERSIERLISDELSKDKIALGRYRNPFLNYLDN